jgi:iron complex transport system substrate-binding protein
VRIVSLLPSATEIVCALGHGEELVGRSSECDYPPEVTSLPAVMRPKTLDVGAPSRAIDARVQATRGRGESLYELDIAMLRGLRPDLLLTQDLCGVCSVTEAEVAGACAVAGITPEVVSLTPRNLEDVWASIERVAGSLKDPEAGRNLVRRKRPHPETEAPLPRRRTAVVEWLDPPILAGLWTPDMVQAAGGEPFGPGSGEPGRRTSWEALRSASLEVVVLSPCSFTVDRTLDELRDSRLARAVDRAAPPDGIVVADEAYFSRPGPRLSDGVDLVRDLLHGTAPRGPMPVARWQLSRGVVA